MKIVEAVVQLLSALGTPFALIGGRAVGARGYPRMTLDYDFMTSDARVLEPVTWRRMTEEQGARVDIRRGEHDDPIAGVTRVISGTIEADILLARGKWEREILERAEPLNLDGIIVPVPVTSDLILLKLAAGGPIDLQDIIVLLATDREQLVAEVESKIDQLQPSVSEEWALVKRSS
jgi:hypothetical protein